MIKKKSKVPDFDVYEITVSRLMSYLNYSNNITKIYPKNVIYRK